MTEDNQGLQAPLPDQTVEEKEVPKMSLIQTITGIFFEPGEVFEDLRKKPFPRLVFPFLVCAVLISTYTFGLNYKLGPERIVQEQLKMPIMERVPDEAKQKMVEDAKNSSTIKTVLTSSIGGIAFLIIFTIISLIYWGGGLAFGGSGNFWHGMAVVAYSSFPIIFVSMVASLIILFLKPADDISFIDSQNGLLRINPNLLIDASSTLKALFSRIDILVIWGVFLSAVGLKNTMKVSNGGAWLFSVIIWLIGTLFAVGISMVF